MVRRHRSPGRRFGVAPQAGARRPSSRRQGVQRGCRRQVLAKHPGTTFAVAAGGGGRVSATPPVGWSEVIAGDVRWQVAPALAEHLLGPDGLRLEEWLQKGQATVIKQGPHRVVHRVALVDGQVIYIKHNLIPDFRSLMRQLVRPSKARMEFDRAVAVAARGVPTTAPLALGERLGLLGSGDSYLVTRALEGTETLNSFLAAAFGNPPTDVGGSPSAGHARLRQQMAKALGRFVAHLHDSGIRHNDLHAANILVQLTDDDQLRLYLIDLGAARLGPRLPWPASLENLILFTRWFVPRSNRADRLRFW